ncbi:hypothetical protein RhiTH_011128 [Rhizoctonia solani]
MGVSQDVLLPIEVERVGDDTYQFRLRTNDTIALGHSEQVRKEDLAFVKLMRSSEDAVWEILLSELEGSPEQDWVFQPLYA